MSAEQRTNDEGLNMLAQEVARVLKMRNWSLAQAEIQTGVGRGTIHNMQRGLRVRPEYVQRFARAVAVKGEEEITERRYLNMSLGLGKRATEALNELIETPDANSPEKNVDDQDQVGELIRISDPQIIRTVKFMQHMSPELRAATANAAGALANAGDLVREEEDDMTLGKNADREIKPRIRAISLDDYIDQQEQGGK